MPVDLHTNGRAAPPSPATETAADDQAREWARRHLDRVRRLKLHVAAFVVGMIVLTPVWALTQWQTSGGFERWSTDHSRRGRLGAVDSLRRPRLGLVVAIVALKVYFDRPTTEGDVEREVRRLCSRR